MLQVPSRLNTTHTAYRIGSWFKWVREVIIDTQYVGSDHTVAEVNDVLRRYNFRPTSQSRIFSPGSGTSSFQITGLEGSAIVRVYAPLEGTAWEVSMSFSGSSCGGGPPLRPPPGAGVVATATSACSDTVYLRFFEGRSGVTSSSQQWPGGGRSYVLSNGDTFRQTLACTPGYKVCYGATRSGGTYWGVGDGNEGCTGCCTTCPTSGTGSLSAGRLVCTGGGVGPPPPPTTTGLLATGSSGCSETVYLRFFQGRSEVTSSSQQWPGGGRSYVLFKWRHLSENVELHAGIQGVLRCDAFGWCVLGSRRRKRRLHWLLYDVPYKRCRIIAVWAIDVRPRPMRTTVDERV